MDVKQEYLVLYEMIFDLEFSDLKSDPTLVDSVVKQYAKKLREHGADNFICESLSFNDNVVEIGVSFIHDGSEDELTSVMQKLSVVSIRIDEDVFRDYVDLYTLDRKTVADIALVRVIDFKRK